MSAASNLKDAYPEKEVHLFFSEAQPLLTYHRRVRNELETRLRGQGVLLRQLRMPGAGDVFAVGDVAASDPERCSARNGGGLIVVDNVRCALMGRAERMKRFEVRRHRWGSFSVCDGRECGASRHVAGASGFRPGG